MDVDEAQPNDQILHDQHFYTQLIGCITRLSSSLATLTASTTPQNPDPERYYTSAVSGEAWLVGLINDRSDPERMRCQLGMHEGVYLALLTELRTIGHRCSQSGVSLGEQVAIFLYTCVTGLNARHVAERFQRPPDKISRYFRKMVKIFSSEPFHTKYVRFPGDGDDIPKKFRDDPKYWPYFKDVVGVIDGCHIPVEPPSRDYSRWQNCNGWVSQYCLFASNFDLQFIYTEAGREGSTTDKEVYDTAHSRGLNPPPGKYFLADAGFHSCDGLLVPYPGVRYRLADWDRVRVRPENKEELFNLRHATARKMIEDTFCILRRRFSILLQPSEYSMDTQAQIPMALCAIHNFIRTHDPGEGPLPDRLDNPLHYVAYVSGYDHPGHQGAPDQEADEDGCLKRMREVRDHIALHMWNDYKEMYRERKTISSSTPILTPTMNMICS